MCLRIIERTDNENRKESKTIKYLLQTEDNEFFEAVLLFEDKLTLCVSSQIGCPIKCVFCRTGYGKFKRNLIFEEIVNQVKEIEKDINMKVDRVSYMGMGEPLLNFDNVVKSMRILKKNFYKLSTIGIPNKIRKLANLDIPLELYFSLHASYQQKRRKLIPFSANHDLKKILGELNEFQTKKGSLIIWYLLLNNINDSDEDAEKLIETLKHLKGNFTVYLKQYCDTGLKFGRSKNNRIIKFKNILNKHNIPNKYSISEGQNINAGCGQLKQMYLKNIEVKI
ncbi:MAG: radical SAM protein [Candidatus Aenigmarchaeota archaeon]|nr:radical SAM protein [Candidatus Aenigmarchaeota archaeon]